jgi:hypothetical protein
MDGDLEGAIIERFERNDEIDPGAVAAGKNGGKTRELRLGDDAGADQLRQDGFDMRADGSVVGAKIEHPERLVVGQNETAAEVQHAEAMRHVIERHVEPRREHGGLLLRRDDRHEVVSQPLRIGLYVKNERRDPRGDPDRIPAAGDQHRRREGNKSADKLPVDPTVDRIAPRHEAERVGDRH